jgi:hypothetical protein
LVFGRIGEQTQRYEHCVCSHHNDTLESNVMATPSYRERMKAASAQRRAEEAQRRRQARLWALTRIRARDAAKDAIRARGAKVAHYSAREIAVLADQLLAEEPELFVASARETVAQGIAVDQAKAAARRLERKSQHTFNAERPANSAVPVHECYEQNGAAK